MGPNYFLETEALCFTYRKQDDNWVIEDINLSVCSDDFFLICGASGSGKSTLCRTFNGLIPHFYGGTFQGEVRVGGVSTAGRSVSDLFALVGMVFQNPETQLFNRTVFREMAFGLESLGLPRPEIERRISATADAIHISHLLHTDPQALSGGEQQLVAIAAVLSLNPRLIILDEPYANLDPANVRRVRSALRSVNRQGIGVIVCEHRLRYTVSDAHRMVVLNRGRIVLDGEPAAIMDRDLESLGLEIPLPVQAARRLDMCPAVMDMDALLPEIGPEGLPADLEPDSPEPIPKGAGRILEVEDVSHSMDGRAILKNISFTLHQGESMAIVGANGAGKTVLLKHLNGLHRPASGQVRIMGEDIRKTRVSLLARQVGIAFQNPNSQFFKLTVWDEITTGARKLGTFNEAWVQEIVNLFHLQPLLTRAPFRLSGGEKKRVAFAAALAPNPAILVLDEPTAGQDGHFRRALGNLLKTIRNRGQSIILVTHDLTFAEQNAHRWMLMAHGKIITAGTPRVVMADRDAMEAAHLEPTDAFRLFSARRS